MKMLFNDRVPEDYYIRLVQLMGREKADRFLERVGYSIKAIIFQISYLEFVKLLKSKPLTTLLIILPVLYLIIRFIME
jgi:hypothetical protein